MINIEQIRTLVDEKIANTGLFVTEISIKPVNKIHVALEKMDGGIVISDCVQVHRHIEAKLDRNNIDYQLDVSSAGMEEPFKVRQQYLKNVGRRVEVLGFDGVKYEGKLFSANNEGIELEMTHRDKKLKKDIITIKQFNYQQIKQTKKIITFK